MTETMTEKPNFALSGRFTAAQRQELLAFLLQNKNNDVSIDCSELTSIDALGAQLLECARRNWNADSRELSFLAAKPDVRDAVRLLGLTDLLPSQEVLS